MSRLQCLLFLGTALVVLSAAQTHAADLEDRHAKATAHLKGEAKAVADRVVKGMVAGWEDNDHKTWAELWDDKGVRVWGRSPKPAKTDQRYPVERFLPSVKFLMGGEDIGMKLAITELDAGVQGDTAVVTWKVIISNKKYKDRMVLGERFTLKRTEGVWKIIEDRAWSVAQEINGKKIITDLAEWRRRDEVAAKAAEKAKITGDLRPYRDALFNAVRSPEAYPVAVKITQGDDAVAFDWVTRGILAVYSTNYKDAGPSFTKALEMDPNVWLPHYAEPWREKKQ